VPRVSVTQPIRNPALKRIFAQFAFAAMLLAAAPCTAAPALTRLPAMFQGSGVFLRVVVNGGKPLWMKLNVGGSTSSLSPEGARTLGLSANRASDVTLRIGSVGFSNVAFRTQADEACAGPDGSAASGVLGEDFLGGRPLWIDTRGRAVWIAQAPPSDDDPPAALQAAAYLDPAR
jgi:hypothetical protein